MPKHGIDLVQCFHAMQQFLLLLDFFLVATFRPERGEFHHQFLALRQKLVQRRIEQSDGHRQAIHFAEQAFEIRPLKREQRVQMLAALGFGIRENHLLNVRQPVLGKEHVLGSAKSDAFRAELSCNLRVARNVGVGTDPKPADFIGHRHEFGEVAAVRIGFDGWNLAFEHSSGRAFERDPVALAESLIANPENFVFLIDRDGLCADHAAYAHAARDHCSVACHSAARSQNADRHFHTVNVVRHGLFAHQHNTVLLRLFDRIVGRKHNHAADSAR